MGKPTSKQESGYLSEYRWIKGRVKKRFREKYGTRVENQDLAKFYKRQTRRARRHNDKKNNLQEW